MTGLVGLVLSLLIVLAIALPLIAVWRVWKIYERKYDLFLLLSIAINSFLRLWARSDLGQVEFVDPVAYYTKVILGLVLEDVALLALCLFLLGVLNGIHIRPKRGAKNGTDAGS